MFGALPFFSMPWSLRLLSISMRKTNCSLVFAVLSLECLVAIGRRVDRSVARFLEICFFGLPAPAMSPNVAGRMEGIGEGGGRDV